MTDKKETKKSSKKKKNILKTLSKNNWAVSTIILSVLLLISVVTTLTGNTFSVGVSSETVGQKVLDFANSQGANAELISSKDDGQFYEVILSIQGEDVPVYATKDGKNLVPSLIPLTAQATKRPSAQPASEDVPKSEEPEAKLFVWSYCPYGVQAQGPLSEVANLLGDNANFIIVPYYDGHGEYEKQQNQIQLCIQKLDSEKYWDYASGFVTDIYTKCGNLQDAECDETESVKLMKSLGIDSEAVLSCVGTEGDALFAEAAAEAQSSGVTGSPTLTVNGVKVNAARDAESYKTAVCSAFNTAPEECDEVLDSSAAAAAGNC